MVDNYDWMKTYSHMDFLRDFGTDFTVPRMLSMESVKRRLDNGMTFLEFNYMTFQAVDFLELYKKHNCILQFCGADQWGNSIMGIELVRKKLGKEVFVLSTSLITDANGNKIGKSAGNAVWVNEDKTSPYEYYQYFRNTPDDLVEKFLKSTEFQRIFKKYDALNNSVQENVGAIRVVKAFVRDEFENKKFQGVASAIYTIGSKAQKLLMVVSLIMQRFLQVTTR